MIILNAEGENFIILDMGANELMDAAFVDRAADRIAILSGGFGGGNDDPPF